jgi:hypothetical protein
MAWRQVLSGRLLELQGAGWGWGWGWALTALAMEHVVSV